MKFYNKYKKENNKNIKKETFIQKNYDDDDDDKEAEK